MVSLRTRYGGLVRKGAIALVLAGVLTGCQTLPQPAPCRDASGIHAFYYTWYGNPKNDGHWRHWNHNVILREGGGQAYTPPEDIGANFYPANGLYSSSNPADLRIHMTQMKDAGVGVAAVTWWGPGDYTDEVLPKVFDAAAAQGIQVCFHIEPFPGRTAAATRNALVYLLDRYGAHPALYRYRGRPLAYIYDSYLVPAKEWATILAPEGVNTIRGTAYDTVMIGLWVKKGDGRFMEKGHFDGFYTYFTPDGFTYGATPANWPVLAQWAQEHGQLFIPSVGPGYDDTRIRPWNTVNQRARENGAYYDRLFAAALAVDPAIISITSFNEWHEGTQIEPAMPKSIEGYTYLDYEDRAPAWYLERSRYWAERWQKDLP